MWRRRSSGNDDSNEEMSSVDEAFCEAGTSFETKHSFLKKRTKDSEEKPFLKMVSSDASFCIGEIESDGDCMENQILSLQEQLFASLIENHNLAEQVKKLRLLVGASESLSEELETERERNKILRHKIRENEKRKEKSHSDHEGERHSPNKIPRSPCRGRFGWRKRGLEKSKSLDQSEFMSFNPDDVQDEIHVNKERRPSTPLVVGFSCTDSKAPAPIISSSPPAKVGIFRSLYLALLAKVKEALEDFSEISDDTSSAPVKEEPLTVKKLRENVVRFSASIKPINDLLIWFISLFHWKSPAATFLSFFIYLAAVVYGYTVTLILAIFIWHLSKNYFKKRGFGFKLKKNTKNSETGDDEGNETKFGDKFVVVFQVARRVQNVLGNISDTAEKLKNLLNWEHHSTRQLYLISWIMLLGSLFFYPSQLATVSGIYLGIKFFVTDFIFYKFPRIRRKYDSTTELWNSLPTDADLERKNEKNGASTSDIEAFLDLFSLPKSEVPLQGWQTGKRCTLINRDKSLTSAFRNGRLYLTNSYLCFERSRSHSEKNIKLPLNEIVSIEKANSYPWIPGGGMAIEILTDNGKAFYFGGILSRDEIFYSILDSCRKSGNVLKRKEKDKEKCKEKARDKEKDEEKNTDSKEKTQQRKESEGNEEENNTNAHSNPNDAQGEKPQLSNVDDTPIDQDKKMSFLEFID